MGLDLMAQSYNLVTSKAEAGDHQGSSRPAWLQSEFKASLHNLVRLSQNSKKRSGHSLAHTLGSILVHKTVKTEFHTGRIPSISLET